VPDPDHKDGVADDFISQFVVANDQSPHFSRPVSAERLAETWKCEKRQSPLLQVANDSGRGAGAYRVKEGV
jgi:hypothetical protein